MADFNDDANYDPNDPENYADVGEMVRQVTGDDPDTPNNENNDEDFIEEAADDAI